MFFISDSELTRILEEDIPYGDATVKALGIEKESGSVCCYPKTEGVVAGISLAGRLFRLAGLTVTLEKEDGALYQGKEPVLKAHGSAAQIHSVYKTAQNIMEYSSGIAGRVSEMLKAARSVNPNVQIAVTRKNFPGTKKISLNAALSAGAIVHRAGLSESILIFDQHRAFSTDFACALKRAKIAEPEKKIAVEAGSLEEALSFAEMGADVVQCERFTPALLSEFVRRGKAINPALIINAAGGVNASNAAEIAASGADVLVTSWVYFGKPFDIKMAIAADS